MKKSLRLALPLVLVSAVLSACGGGPDTTKPTVSLVNLPSSVTQTGAVTLAASASDDQGIRSVDFYVDGSLVQSVTSTPYQTSYTWTVATNGTHTVRVVATDTSGNTSEASQTVTVAIPDTTKPVVALVDLKTSVTQAGAVTLKANASDDQGVKSVAFYVDGTLVQTVTSSPYQTSYTWTTNGTHTVKVVATDLAGNTSEASQTVTVTLPDTTRPTVTISGLPTSTVTTAGTLTASVNAADDTGVASLHAVLSMTDAAGTTTTLLDQTTTSSSLSVPFAVDNAHNGTYTLTVTATDAAGNTGTATQNVVVSIPASPPPASDTTPPVVTIAGFPTTAITTAGTFTPSVSATDNVGVVKLRAVLTVTNAGGTTTLIDQYSTTATSFSFPISLDATRNGTYTLTVTATDAAGNVGTASQGVVVNIPASPNPGTDTQKPGLTITLPPSPITVAGNYNVVVTTSDNVGVVSLTGYIDTPFLGRIQLGNLDPAGGTVPVNVVKAMNGTSTVTFIATDAAGNSTTQSASMTVAIP